MLQNFWKAKSNSLDHFTHYTTKKPRVLLERVHTTESCDPLSNKQIWFMHVLLLSQISPFRHGDGDFFFYFILKILGIHLSGMCEEVRRAFMLQFFSFHQSLCCVFLTMCRYNNHQAQPKCVSQDWTVSVSFSRS